MRQRIEKNFLDNYPLIAEAREWLTKITDKEWLDAEILEAYIPKRLFMFLTFDTEIRNMLRKFNPDGEKIDPHGEMCEICHSLARNSSSYRALIQGKKGIEASDGMLIILKSETIIRAHTPVGKEYEPFYVGYEHIRLKKEWVENIAIRYFEQTQVYAKEASPILEGARPTVLKSDRQKEAILDAIQAHNLNPAQLPKREIGKKTIKATIRKDLRTTQPLLFSSDKSFDSNWQALRDEGLIAENNK